LSRRELHDVFGIVIHETQKAWLIDAGERENVWLPKSLVEFDPQPGKPDRGTFTMPVGFATQKGLT
jgi:hypothetical protein